MNKTGNRRVHNDGSGTLTCIGVIMAVALCVIALVIGGHVLTASYHLQAVADISALGGGEISATRRFMKNTSSHSGRECLVAGEIAQRNGVHMQRCFLQGDDTYVVVSRLVQIGPIKLLTHARSRAGPI